MKKTIFTTSTILGLALALLVVSIPVKTHAFQVGQLIDPFCLFACDDDNGQSSNNNSNNNNNNNNNSGNHNSGNRNNNHTTRSTYQEPLTPVYSYDYSSRTYEPLRVSCYPMPTSVQVGNNVQWVAYAYGGNGSYNYSWTGTDGLNGYGSSVYKTYNNLGYKSATVTVTSGSQSIAKNCDNTVNVYDNYQYSQSYYPQNYYQTYSYPSLAVYCSANTTYLSNGGSVTWTAYPSGGNGAYTYSWSGTDGLWGSSQSVYFNYINAGSKYGTVTVYSNGQTATQSCSNVVTVANPSVNYGSYYSNGYYMTPSSQNGGLDIGCYADPTTASINQPVTWSVEVSGGVAPYTYSWTGSNDLVGSQSSIIKYYSTSGSKNAVVTVTSANGKTGVKACSNAVAVRSNATVAKKATPAVAKVQPVQTVQPVATQSPVSNNNSGAMTAASLFSLNNVPWGWVAVLIILVLFATVLYLLFNRNKI